MPPGPEPPSGNRNKKPRSPPTWDPASLAEGGSAEGYGAAAGAGASSSSTFTSTRNNEGRSAEVASSRWQPTLRHASEFAPAPAASSDAAGASRTRPTRAVTQAEAWLGDDVDYDGDAEVTSSTASTAEFHYSLQGLPSYIAAPAGGRYRDLSARPRPYLPPPPPAPPKAQYQINPKDPAFVAAVIDRAVEWANPLAAAIDRQVEAANYRPRPPQARHWEPKQPQTKPALPAPPPMPPKPPRPAVSPRSQQPPWDIRTQRSPKASSRPMRAGNRKATAAGPTTDHLRRRPGQRLRVRARAFARHRL